jgi:dTDP-4-dehydrorhamnose reductase
MEKILLFGSSGYIGSEFATQLGVQSVAAPSYRDITSRADVEALIYQTSPSAVINAAGYTGKPNVDACEDHKDECYHGNVTFPVWIASACNKLNVPFGHVSSGCIYNGHDKIYTEEDAPDFSFVQNNCSYYSGTKAECEMQLKQYNNAYVWRLRIPFDHNNNPRNYITKMLTYDKILNLPNSVSHRSEYVAACIKIMQQQLLPGTYNVTNPGSITATRLFELIKQYRPEFSKCIDSKKYFKDVAEFSQYARAPRSNCVLDTNKLSLAGITMSPVEDIIIDCIKRYDVA